MVWSYGIVENQSKAVCTLQKKSKKVEHCKVQNIYKQLH